MILPFKCVIEHLVTSKHITCKIKWIKWMFHKKWVCVKVSQSYLTLCNPKDCSLPGFSVHGILQARILGWVALSFSRDFPNPGIEPRSPSLQADSLPSEPPGKPKLYSEKVFGKTYISQSKDILYFLFKSFILYIWNFKIQKSYW